MSVKVSNLTKVYGNQSAVDNINFEINQGEVVGFLGPNGAGKTTTMKMITCYIPQTEGTITVDGHDTIADPATVKQLIGYLPEHNPLYLSMYVKEYLTFIADVHKLKNKKERVDEMIELTGLKKEQSKLISSLSKGYRQRIGLAQAMIHDPKVLILDEPTSGLDPNQLAEIREVIRKMKKEKTVIFSTHIMQEIQAVCDRVLIIDEGVLIADDHIDTLQSRIQESEIIEMKFHKEVSSHQFQSVKNVITCTQVDKRTIHLATVREADIHTDLFYKAVELDNPIISMVNKGNSVEEIFQKLTKR